MTNGLDPLGSGSSPDELKRTVIATSLSLAVIVVWQLLFPPPKPPPRPESETEQSQQIESGDLDGLDAPNLAPPAELGDRIDVRTPLYHATFSSLGGVLRGFELKTFPQTQEDDSPLVELVEGHAGPSGAWGVDLARKGERASTSDVLFQADRASVELVDGEQTLVFTGELPGWGTIHKRYTFHADDFAIGFTVEIEPSDDSKIQWLLVTNEEIGYMGKGKTHWDKGSVKLGRGESFELERVELAKLRKKARKGKTDKLTFDTVRWASFDDRYFVSAIVDKTYEAKAFVRPKADGRRVLLELVRTYVPTNDADGSAVFDFTLYLGPKDLNLLKAIEQSLHQVIDFGYVGSLSRFFVLLLSKLQGMVGNWGFAIILLTLIVRGVMFPLTLTTFKSSKKMQLIQPEMKEVREQYKDDPQKMQQEMMALYKRNKVNPLGGCLPMLLQFPIFIGLYYALAQSIDLRHAEFGWWIHDLSAADPYYITPIVMGFTMFLQQKMMPMAAADPMQQKMFQWMPVIFTFFFLNFPSGLVVYWLVSNLFSIGQQAYIRKTVN